MQPMPGLPDILRTARALGFNNEYEQFKREFNIQETLSEKEVRENGELVLIHYNGLGPYKDQFSINVALPAKTTQVNFVRVALPVYKERSFRIDHADIEINSNIVGKTYVGEDITKIATRNLKDRYPRILRKTIARLVVKESAKYGLRKLSDSDNQEVDEKPRTITLLAAKDYSRELHKFILENSSLIGEEIEEKVYEIGKVVANMTSCAQQRQSSISDFFQPVAKD